MAVNDFYRLTVRGSLGSGDPVLNIFHYMLLEDVGLVTGSEGEYLAGLNAQFQTGVVGTWLNIVSEDYRIEEFFSQHVGGVEFLSTPAGTGYEGNIADQSLPRFVSYNIILNRETAVTRNGHKRICGVPESANDNGSFTGSSTDMGLFVASLANPLNYTAGDLDFVFTPIIPRYNVGGTAIIAHSIVGSASLKGFGTQNSRKD